MVEGLGEVGEDVDKHVSLLSAFLSRVLSTIAQVKS